MSAEGLRPLYSFTCRARVAATNLLVLTDLMLKGAAMSDVLVSGFIHVWGCCRRRWPGDVSGVQAAQTAQAVEQGPGDGQGRIQRGPHRLQ